MLGIGIGVDARMPLMERHMVGFAVTVDLHVETGAQRVDDGRADAMQAAHRVVRGVAELRAGMQFGQYDLHAGQLGFGFLVDGDASAVVVHGDRTVRMQGDDDPVAKSRQSLIHGVVDDLPQTVHQALRIRGADIHARTLAHRVEPFKNGEILRAVFLFSHVPLPLITYLDVTKSFPKAWPRGSNVITDRGSRAASANGTGGAASTWSSTRSGGYARGSRRTRGRYRPASSAGRPPGRNAS